MLNKKRFWQADEVCVLLDAVQEHYAKLTSKFSKCFTKKDRELLWESIAERYTYMSVNLQINK